MNRATALLLAMAALLAHTLAIHHDEARLFGVPYDSAHVTYTLARNWVYAGELAWHPGSVGLEAVASPLWVVVAAVAERAYLPVTIFTQVCGIFAALLTVALSARFATNRIAGIVPPLLLVTSGSVAAAAASGTELPFVALCLTGAFSAFEHRERRPYTLALMLLVATRPEGVLMLAAFAGLTVAERWISRGDESAPMPYWTLIPPALVAVLLCFVRGGDGSSLYGGLLGSILSWDTARVVEGLAYVRDFFVCGVSPALVIFAVGALAFGKLSGAGARALGLFCAWGLIVVLEGGGTAPFGMALMPALPLAFIAAQQGMIAAIDTEKPWVERAIWEILILSSLFSALASKFPGNLGPLQIGGPHERWMTATAQEPYGYEPVLGRSALQQELQLTSRMRDLGAFLRDNVGPDHTILSPWPGALGYLSGSTVFDLFGRAGHAPGWAGNPPWATAQSADILAALELRPDFVLPGALDDERLRSGGGGLDEALLARDRSTSPERRVELESLLSEYELVTLPVEPLARGIAQPFFILRRRDLGYAPELSISRRGATLRIELSMGESHEPPRAGHPQLAQLALDAIDEQGRHWSIDPQGRLREAEVAFARTDLYLRPQGERKTRLIEWRQTATADGARIVELRAQLFNPGVRRRHPMAAASAEAELRLN